MPDKRVLDGLRRCALYTRVSSEEQAKHGLSLAAQLETLQTYSKQNKLHIVDVYTDEGISARKPYKKRPEFMRMLSDVEAGKIDLILIIKLDRFFRNVGDYYEVARILDAHNVAWIATEEEYDTTTANGRLYLNIRLSMAQDEADRDSERIHFVFEGKKQRGEVLTGGVPLGYAIENKRLVVVPAQAEKVKAIFQHYIDSHSIGATVRWAREVLDLYYSPDSIRKMLKNRVYIGERHGIKNFCEPIIERGQFARVQELLLSRSQRNSGGVQKNIFLFSGLLRCADCGSAMHATAVKGHKYYRCRKFETYHSCAHDRRVREDYIESWLLTNLTTEMEKYNADIRARSVNRLIVDTAKIKRKMEKLKELYLEDMIDIELYQRDYTLLHSQLEAAEKANAELPPEIDILKAKELLALYPALPEEGKKAFWQRIIKRLEIDADKNIRVFPA